MSLHLIKLCVGVASIAQLRNHQRRRLAEMASRGEVAQLTHVTRHMPRRRDEILEPGSSGSLFWVIRGVVQARQPIIDLRRVTGEEADMDPIWAPWRMEYIRLERPEGCILCGKPREDADESNLILHRADLNFVMMNAYPYN
ncbi:MAG: DUF1489 family protein, partial [Hyphomicrobiales bacterium]